MVLIIEFKAFQPANRKLKLNLYRQRTPLTPMICKHKAGKLANNLSGQIGCKNLKLPKGILTLL
ncbi:MAG: hypothetical protein BGO39_25360 [Chloroflexi bacterium 54-19]|nr:MAG: hypothetical protein BGO39_25360 [Chloroflexi bacterium 54-19]